MRVGGRAALGFLGACAVVAGCSEGGSGDPVTLPPTTASSTTVPTTGSPTTAPPPTTDDASPTPTTTLILPDEHVDSVDAFVADFFTALNTAKDTGDFAAFDSLYLPQCTGCIELREELVGWLADGGTVEGGDWVILQQSSGQFPDGSKASANAFAFKMAATIGSLDGDATEVPESLVQLFQIRLLAANPWTIEVIGRTELGDE